MENIYPLVKESSACDAVTVMSGKTGLCLFLVNHYQCQDHLIRENILLPPSGFRKYHDSELPSQLTMHTKGVFNLSAICNLQQYNI